MKLTYYLPTTAQDQEMVCAQVRHVFQVEPSIVLRATKLQVDLDVLIDGREILSLVGQMPYVVVILDDLGCLTWEQRQWVSSQPDCEVKREYGPTEVLYERIEGSRE